MFRIRPVQKDDLEDLYDLSALYTFINLPHDKELIQRKIDSSLRSFKQMSSDLSRDHYIFVLEDLDDSIRGIRCKECLDADIGHRVPEEQRGSSSTQASE